MKLSVKIIMAVPFLVHLLICVVVGLTAAYSWAFTGETIWLLFDWAQDPAFPYSVFLLLTLLVFPPATPLADSILDSTFFPKNK